MMSSTWRHGCEEISRQGAIVNGGSKRGFTACLQAYAMTLGLWPLGIAGYRISQPGDVTPPKTSTPWCAVSFLAVPMVSNHGSWIRKRLELVSLFKRAWVAALHLHMLTDAIDIEGCANIRRRARQLQIGGARGSMSGM